MSTLDDLGRSILFGLRNFVKEFGITLIILILSLIPFLGFIAAPIIFLVQAMYVGFSNLDFTLNRYFSINGSVDFIRKNLGFSLGNGVAFMLIIMIPVTLGAAAATLKAVPRIYRPSFT